MARIHRTGANQFARDLVHIQQSIVQEGVEDVGKRTPSEYTPHLAADLCGYKLALVASFKIKYSFEF